MKIFYLVLMTLYLISCAPKVEPEKTSLSFNFPKSDRSKRSTSRYQQKNVAVIGSFGSATGVVPSLVSLDDIDCYMVAIAYPVEGQNVALSGTCGNSTQEFRSIQIASITVADGGQIIIEDVPVGSDRTFYVIGFQHTSNGLACPDFRSIQPSEYANMSAPVVVGQTTQGILAQEENIVNVQISMTGAVELNGCRHNPFSWVVGGVFNESKFDGAVFGP